jgi:hypothetical protein
MYLAPTMEMVLFHVHLEMVRSAADQVEMSPGYLIRLPPLVSQVGHGVVYFLFVGACANSKMAILYVIVLHVGKYGQSRDEEYSVRRSTLQCIHHLLPCVRPPHSFTAALSHLGGVPSSASNHASVFYDGTRGWMDG